MTLTDEKNPHDSTTFYGWHDYAPNVPSSSDAWASTARGWLWNHSESSVGNYCDYGVDHYRSGHEYCKPGKCDCRQSNPGNIHCIVYRGTDGMQHSRYVETVEQAHEWIEETAGFASQFKLALTIDSPRLGRSRRAKRAITH